MTEYEKKLFQSIPSPHSKWWVPASWFSNLVSQARAEGRIKDDYSMNKILEEMHTFRTSCGNLYSYDWISVPLVYTQVVTLCVYTFFLASLMGSQYLDPELGYPGRSADFYIPYFTLLQFFFYMGWLKVAEQLINPFGEDDDDFDMTWVVDRNLQVSYLSVDDMYMEFPDVEKDIYWDEVDPHIPHTTASISTKNDPFMGSMANLSLPDAAMSTVVPLDTIAEHEPPAAGIAKTVSEHSLFQHFKDNHHLHDAAHEDSADVHERLSALLQHHIEHEGNGHATGHLSSLPTKSEASDLVKSTNAIDKLPHQQLPNPKLLDEQSVDKLKTAHLYATNSVTKRKHLYHPDGALPGRTPISSRFQIHHVPQDTTADPRRALLLRRLEKHPSANDSRVGKWLKNKFGLNPLPAHLRAVRSDSINSMPVWLNEEDAANEHGERSVHNITVSNNHQHPNNSAMPSPATTVRNVAKTSPNELQIDAKLNDVAKSSTDNSPNVCNDIIVNVDDDDTESATSTNSLSSSDHSGHTVSSIKQLLP